MPPCARVALALVLVVPAVPASQALDTVVTHDNVRSAGHHVDGMLRLSLWAGMGAWRPEGPGGRVRQVAALGEEGRPLAIPAPLIRVVEGAQVYATIRNTLSSALRVRGLCDRPGPCEPVEIPAGGTREIRLVLTTPGTYHYWASTDSAALDRRTGTDTQVGGAIVVDPRGGSPADRVFVMSMLTEAPGPAAAELAVINGRSWPYTERLQYGVGDAVRWRVVNLTSAPHAMHLHGFYFDIESLGDGVRDQRYSDENRRTAVTEQMPPGRTMSLKWVPERAGNWLFHCHMLVHMMPPDEHHGGSAVTHTPDDPAAGMAGLVLGVHVTGSPAAPSAAAPDSARRALRLTIEPDVRHGALPSYKVNLSTAGRPAPRINDRAVPGPVMVLTRGEPVAVEVVNRLTEPTAIHWHGIELESYDDGVPGFGGTTGSVTPPVAPGGTFTARFTPSRAGTFIYHTHWHNASQLAAGIYGPIVVLEPGESYDATTDHLIVLGLDGQHLPPPNEPIVVNGDAAPRPLPLKAGVAHRLRVINITADNVALTLQLVSRFDPIQWTLVGKDGSPIPARQRVPRAARQLVTVGETYDFELAPMPPADGTLWLELRRGTGEFLRQWPVEVR